jgi:hypothetical protein
VLLQISPIFLLKAFDLPQILVSYVKLEFISFDYYRVKCCINLENEKSNKEELNKKIRLLIFLNSKMMELLTPLLTNNAALSTDLRISKRES